MLVIVRTLSDYAVVIGAGGHIVMITSQELLRDYEQGDGSACGVEECGLKGANG
jgi:hypothetical protein